MKAVFASLLPFALCARLVAAHGIVTSVTIDGKVYKGNPTVEDSSPSVDSPIRRVASNSPVTDLNDPQMSCGLKAQMASQVADAMPGSTVSFQWSTSWPHVTGPMMTYMTPCGETSCDKFDPSGAKWFKIAELGQVDGNSDQWYQQQVHDGKPVDVTIPQNLAPGGYLMRHEIISLQGTSAEYYPSCTQVKIGGNGNGTPDVTVSFPGAYHSSDQGISSAGGAVYNGDFTYQFPGGPVAKLTGGGASAPAPSESASSADGQASSTEATNPASTMSEAAVPSSTAAPTPASSPAGDMPSSMPAPASSGVGSVPLSTAAPSPSSASTGAMSTIATPSSTDAMSTMAAPSATEATSASSSQDAPAATQTYWSYVPPAASASGAPSSDSVPASAPSSAPPSDGMPSPASSSGAMPAAAPSATPDTSYGGMKAKRSANFLRWTLYNGRMHRTRREPFVAHQA